MSRSALFHVLYIYDLLHEHLEQPLLLCFVHVIYKVNSSFRVMGVFTNDFIFFFFSSFLPFPLSICFSLFILVLLFLFLFSTLLFFSFHFLFPHFFKLLFPPSLLISLTLLMVQFFFPSEYLLNPTL